MSIRALPHAILRPLLIIYQPSQWLRGAWRLVENKRHSSAQYGKERGSGDMQAAKPHLHPKALLSLQLRPYSKVFWLCNLLEVTLVSRGIGEYTLQRSLPSLAIFWFWGDTHSAVLTRHPWSTDNWLVGHHSPGIQTKPCQGLCALSSYLSFHLAPKSSEITQFGQPQPGL